MMCVCCAVDLPESSFAICGEHKTKRGETKLYRRKTCTDCYTGGNRDRAERQKNRKMSRLLAWPASVLVLVTGIYSHDLVDGSNRICIYKSVYGSHALTISALSMCPVTWEFEL